MKRDKFLILSIVILFILNLFTLAYIMWGFGPHPKHNPPGGDMHDDRPPRPDELIINRLKLNDEQIKKFQLLKEEHRSQVRELQEDSRKLHDEYFGLLKADKVDTAKASSVLAEISKNQKLLDIVTFEHFEKIKALCDPQQKELFNTFIDEISRSFKPPARK